jgi:hypothetical protein
MKHMNIAIIYNKLQIIQIGNDLQKILKVDSFIGLAWVEEEGASKPIK